MPLCVNCFVSYPNTFFDVSFGVQVFLITRAKFVNDLSQLFGLLICNKVFNWIFRTVADFLSLRTVFRLCWTIAILFLLIFVLRKA
eukprot:7573577-Heterocapsa_arctica.AAC.1